MAFAHGELAPEEAARIATALERDPELAARVARFRNVRAALRKVYDSVAEEPVPERLRALLGDVASHEPRNISAAPARTKGVRQGLGPASWAAIAIALMIGVVAGRLATPAPFLVQKGAVLAAGASLSRALSEKLSTDPPFDHVRLGGSFYAGEDGVCRTFTRDDVSGIACRDGEEWLIRFAVSRGAGPDPGVALMAMVDTMIDGAPLTPAEEAEVRVRGWRR